jgi:pimeloyl-ACP methyl ester carboxylesterase
MKPLPLIAAALLFALSAPARAADPTPKTTASSFDSKGTKIAYFESGAGTPIILIHGLHSSANINWVLPGTFKLLAQDHHVVAFDIRGHGDSDKPNALEDYGPQMVDDVIRLMDHLKIPKAHLVGYSLGGIIALNFSANHPDRALSITVGGMGWLNDTPLQHAIFQKLADSYTGPTPAACAQSVTSLGLSEKQIRAIKSPVEILVGDHDPCKPLYAEPAHSARPDWPLITIENASHYTCFTLDPYKTGVADWIKKNSK